MKKITIFILLTASFVFSQSKILKTLDSENSSKSFYEIVNDFKKNEMELNIKNGYFLQNGIKTKAPNWKIFKREEWLWENRINLATGEFPKTNSIAEYEKFKLNKSLKKETS